MEKLLHHVHLCLGSNVGDRVNHLSFARSEIDQTIGSIIRASLVYESEPWMMPDAGWFLNQVVTCQTHLDPTEVLKRTQFIEHQRGAARKPRGNNAYESRLLDIDILYFNGSHFISEMLTVPHPNIAHRRFVLTPMAEIEPDFRHPILGSTQLDLLIRCPDKSIVFPLNI